MEVEDKLNFENNPRIKGMIGNKKIIYTDKIQRKNFDFISRIIDRDLLLTNLAIYDITGNNVNRRIKIEDLKGITISKTSNQFVLHCNQNEYDYLYIYENMKKLIKILQSLYESLTSKIYYFARKLKMI